MSSNDIMNSWVVQTYMTCLCRYIKLTTNLRSGIEEYFWVLSSCEVQSWILYKRHCELLRIPQKERIDLLKFVTYISNVLTSCDSDNTPEGCKIGNEVNHLEKIPLKVLIMMKRNRHLRPRSVYTTGLLLQKKHDMTK